MNGTAIFGPIFVGTVGTLGAIAGGPIGAGIAAALASMIYVGMRDASRRFKEASHIDQIASDDPNTVVADDHE